MYFPDFFWQKSQKFSEFLEIFSKWNKTTLVALCLHADLCPYKAAESADTPDGRQQVKIQWSSNSSDLDLSVIRPFGHTDRPPGPLSSLPVDLLSSPHSPPMSPPVQHPPPPKQPDTAPPSSAATRVDLSYQLLPFIIDGLFFLTLAYIPCAAAAGVLKSTWPHMEQKLGLLICPSFYMFRLMSQKLRGLKGWLLLGLILEEAALAHTWSTNNYTLCTAIFQRQNELLLNWD